MNIADDFYQVQEIYHLPDSRNINPPGHDDAPRLQTVYPEIDWQKFAGVSFIVNLILGAALILALFLK